MPLPNRLRVLGLASLAVICLGVAAWTRSSARATAIPTAGMSAAAVGRFGGVAGAAELSEDAPPKVYLYKPMTAEAAATWVKLQKKIVLAFPNETPLEDMIKFIKDAVEPHNEKGERSSKDPGLQVYVDPVGLQEAEKTLTSPVVIHLENVPVATSLKLALKQLGLTFFVQDDGIVVITAENSEGDRGPDANMALLNEIHRLRNEVTLLRQEVAASQRGVSQRGPAVK